jgi:hypothetical protein
MQEFFTPSRRLAMTVGLFLLGCPVACSQIEAERLIHAQAYVAGHPELSGGERAEILAGRISKGMSREQVVASLGGLACRPPVHRWVSDGVDHEFCEVQGETRHSGTILIFRADRLLSWDEYKH